MENEIIQKAFNAGYLIEQHLPDLSKLLVNGFQERNNPYAEGFIAGANEMGLERARTNPKYLHRLIEGLGEKNEPDAKGRDDKGMDIDI